MSEVPFARLSRRHLMAGLGAVFAAASTPAAWAQSAWPDKPIRLYVGYPAGGGTDYVARMIAAKLSQELGQQVLVMNMPGATGAIALERVAHSPPDGYSLIVISAADTILPALRAKLPFDMRHDLALVAPAVTGALALVVNPALPVKNVRELVALAQARPGALNYGSPGVGNSQHLAGEFFNRLAKVKIVHVPFKGGAEAINATVAGDIQVAFASLAPALPLVEAGKLRMLGVTTRSRSAAAPGTPTIAEAGVAGYDRATWFGIAAPAGTPREIVAKLNAAIARGMQGADTREMLLKQGLETMSQSPEQFAAFVQEELSQNAAIVQEMGIKAE
ncbi:tripartite tricarboxylate transporter substrate binding protein [Caenimonas aquaedulcis]|uniref:Tripartite tricarboxylate transporter substrate binding protein n=1 Tax=Caenimonas aquaedulcis TaxID=2793270 RepID=A0A931H2H8_9BURK|nr:tripartite tricarboxylate transporter substrate binding protein [Caenimonas aquaedulcis]MBG9387399.1 tripartite tricarboxylate transporter substrate binding protein [Caenimonas aquaedulcis]